MIKDDGKIQLDAILHQVVEILVMSAKTAASDTDWTESVLDERITENDFCSLATWRITTTSGEVRELDYPTGVGSLMSDLRDLRHEKFFDEDKFFGILISVYPDGRFSIQFDFDPNCAVKMFT